MKLKTLPGPGGHITPMEDGMVGGVGGGGAGGGLILGFHGERGAALNIQNPGVQCRLLKGDQSHFEAHGASFVCERCEVLPK